MQSAGRANAQWQHHCRILLDPMWKVCSNAFFIFNSVELPFRASNFPGKKNCIRNVFVLVSCHAIQETSLQYG